MKLKQLKSNVWEKKENDFENNYPYCSSCGSSETFCQCKGHNQALAELSEVELVVDIERMASDLDKLEDKFYKGCQKHLPRKLWYQELSKALSSSMSEWLRLERGKE